MKTLRPGDFLEFDTETNKQFVLAHTSSFVTTLEGTRFSGSFETGSATTTTNGVFKGPLFGSVERQFYIDEYRPETTQSLHNKLTLIQVSQSVFDEKLKENSVILADTTSSTTFVDDGFGNLVVSGSTTYVGNVFYEFGSIVVTDTGSYTHVGLGGFDLTFRSKHRKKTLTFQAQIEPSEYNFSTNPTARLRGGTTLNRPRYSYTIEEVSQSYSQSISDETIIPEFFGFDPSGSVSSSLTPYVTTVGWYDEVGDLLAAAKLSTPIPVPNDFPMVFRAKIDI